MLTVPAAKSTSSTVIDKASDTLHPKWNSSRISNLSRRFVADFSRIAT
jgi:hypothetical protein